MNHNQTWLRGLNDTYSNDMQIICKWDGRIWRVKRQRLMEFSTKLEIDTTGFFFSQKQQQEVGKPVDLICMPHVLFPCHSAAKDDPVVINPRIPSIQMVDKRFDKFEIPAIFQTLPPSPLRQISPFHPNFHWIDQPKSRFSSSLPLFPKLLSTFVHYQIVWRLFVSVFLVEFSTPLPYFPIYK